MFKIIESNPVPFLLFVIGLFLAFCKFVVVSGLPRLLNWWVKKCKVPYKVSMIEGRRRITGYAVVIKKYNYKRVIVYLASLYDIVEFDHKGIELLKVPVKGEKYGATRVYVIKKGS